MKEQRFLCSPQSAAAQPPPPNPNRTRIEIHWGEAVAKAIEIRFHHIEMATKVCCLHLKPDCRQGYHAKLVLTAQAQKIFTSRPER
jgi:hypothetical protein